MSETVSGRLPDDTVRNLDELGRETGRSRSEVLRDVVDRGLAAARLERALQAYRKGEVSIGRAAEMAGVPLTTLLDEMERAGVPFHYGVNELEEDLDWADAA